MQDCQGQTHRMFAHFGLMVISCTQAVTLATGHVIQPPSDGPAMYVR